MKKISLILIFAIMFMSISMASLVNASNPKVSVTVLNQNPDPVKPGEYVEVRWQIENNENEQMQGLKFKIDPSYPFSLDPGTNPIKNVPRLGAFQTGEDAYVVFYKIKVDSEASDGEYELDYEFSYDDSGVVVKGESIIRVEQRDYVIGISNIKTEPEEIAPGNYFKISFDVINYASSSVSDLSANFNLQSLETVATSRTELPFTPIKNSNQKLIKIIRPNEKQSLSFDFSLEIGAESKVHKMPLNIVYYNNKGTQFSQDFILGIPIFEKPTFLINLENSEVFMNQQRGKVVLSISNTGLSRMNFLNIELLQSEDYKIISSNMIYLGNLDSDDFDTMDFEIYLDSDKTEIPISLKINYKDQFNNEHKEIKDIILKLYSSEDAIKYGLMNAKNYTPTIIFIVLIIIGGLWYWRKKRNKNI